MSEQQNPREVLRSLQRQTALDADNSQKPFSIREYVVASRQKDIIRSWPFPERYLGIFQSRGINTLLPPFESHNSALQSLRGRPARSENSKETFAVTRQSSTEEQVNVSRLGCNLSESDEAVSEICSHDCRAHESDLCVNVQPCNGVVNSAKKLRVKRKLLKGKCKKKKSVVKILDVTEPCLSQNKFIGSGVEESKKTINGEQNCESELSEDDQNLAMEPKMDDCDVANTNISRTKKAVYRLRNYSSRRTRSTSRRGRGKKV